MPTQHSPQPVSARNSDVTAGAVGTATFECPPFFLTHATPHAGILAGCQCPGKAVGSDGATVTHGFRLRDLRSCGAGSPDGEEQFRVLVSAGRVVAPIHIVNSLKRHVPPSRSRDAGDAVP